ncbi:MAG: recombinase family protein [Bryobacteraceae bacterium]
MPKDRFPNPSDPKTVGIWIRVSTEDQARGESPEHHEKRARHYAEAKGWNVREVYHLEAVSGKSVMGQPETQRMLEHIRAGHITGLIFSKLARLARNTRELLDFADIFRAHDADLISLQESIDTSTPAGRLFYTMIAAMAQWEREEIAERVAASVPIRAKLGKPLGGAAPFGYRWLNRELVPDPAEAPIRKLLYEYFLEHRRKKSVARLLNEGGYRTRNGSKFTDTTVDRLLRDPSAKGERRANYTKSLGDKKSWQLKPESEWVLFPIEPIVSEELWTQCNALLEERRNGKKPGRKPVQLFAGIVYCTCGQKMYVPSNTPKYICQKCRNKIPAGDLETVFHEQLKAFVLSPTDVAAHLASADEAIKQKEELVDSLEKERRQVVEQMDKVYRAYIADEVSVQGYGRQYRPLEERLNQLESEIPKIQADLDFARIQFLSSDEILSEARDLYTRWPELPFQDKRTILENITEKVVIGKDDVAIDLCYLPSAASKLVAKGQRNFRGSSRRST